MERNIRNYDRLYVFRETYHCATDGQCVACAYKIATFDVVQDTAFCLQVPNVRPESCPRFLHSKTINTSLGLSPGINILTVGDGDFSFSNAIKNKLLQIHNQNHYDTTTLPKSHLVATSLESSTVLSQTYPNLTQILEDLHSIQDSSKLQVSVLMQVDATQLQQTLIQQTSPHKTRTIPSSYHRIIWNFPCLVIPHGQDGQNQQMESNKTLIRNFITSVLTTKLLQNGGEIHITHKTKPPFDQWNLVEQVMLAQQLVHPSQRHIEIQYKGSIVFDKCLFPSYIPRKALDRKSFSYHDACIFIFTASTASTASTSYNDDDDYDNNNNNIIPCTISNPTKQEILPLSLQMLQQIRQIHLLHADRKAYEAVERKYGNKRRRVKK